MILSPVHLYSMRQAIEESFILDVLQNYTTYKSYWKLHKAIENDIRCSDSPQPQKVAESAFFAVRVLIAAHALAPNLTIVTANLREFEQIPTLSAVSWL